MSWFKRLFCDHYWSDSPLEMSLDKPNFKVGSKDWRTDESWWVCAKCKKVKVFKFNHVPFNWAGNLK